VRAALEQRFAALAAWGPDCVTAWTPAAAAADVALQAELDATLERWPFLQRDPSYVAFLRHFAGALVVRVDGLVLSLYGFSHDIGMHLVDGPGEPVSDGCLVICDGCVPQPVRRRVDPVEPVLTKAVGFGVEATGDRAFGIYRFVDGGPPTFFCSTFLELLDAILATDGQLDQTTSMPTRPETS
jgi:hypothetical protein